MANQIAAFAAPACCSVDTPEPGRAGRCSWLALQGRCARSEDSPALCPVACGECLICAAHPQRSLYTKIEERANAHRAKRLASATNFACSAWYARERPCGRHGAKNIGSIRSFQKQNPTSKLHSHSFTPCRFPLMNSVPFPSRSRQLACGRRISTQENLLWSLYEL